MATLALTAALTFTPIATMGERWIADEYVDAIRKEADHRNHTSGNVATPPPTDLRELVAAYFPPWAVADAMKVIRCETGGTFNPRAWNSRSGASGLFQQMPRYWAARSAAAGWAGADIFDAEANIAVSAWLWRQTETWQHWVCKP